MNHIRQKIRSSLRSILALGLVVVLVASNGGSVAADFSFNQNDINSIIGQSPFYDPNDVVCGPGGNVIALKGSDNPSQAMDFFVNHHGLTVPQAAAIVGNLQQESGKFLNPTDVNPTSGAYGIAQWLGGRLDTLKTQPNYDTLITQLNFLWSEITTGTEKNDGALNAIKSDPYPPIDKMVFDWESLYERAGEALGSGPMNNRINNANDLVKTYGASTQGTGSGGNIDSQNCYTSGGPVNVPASCAQWGTGKGKFLNTNATVYPNVDKMCQQAKIITGRSFAPNLCETQVEKAWNNDTAGVYYSAYRNSPDGSQPGDWLYQVAHGHAHPGDRNPPVGALLFWQVEANPAIADGHVAIYMGNNMVFSTDVLGPGHAYVVPDTAVEGSPWNLSSTYLGWSDPVFHGVLQ